MLLIDLNQTLISAFMANVGSNPNVEVNENLVRHIVLSTILHFKIRFGEEYGQIVLCDDNKNYWRRDIHPYYKQNRIKKREDSKFDWELIFNNLKTIKAELKEHFPYKFISVSRAEADDIVAVLAKTYHTEENILILSNDHDFLQLQKYPNVRQYSPTQKRFLKSKDTRKELFEKIVRGDAGDGVPNILSDGDTFMVVEKRQTPLRQTKIDQWYANPSEFKSFLLSDENIKKNFFRNDKVISLDNVPLEIEFAIIDSFESQSPKKKDFIKYFIKNNLRLLAESANQF